MEDFITHAFALHPGRQIDTSDALAALLEAPEPAWVHLQADAEGTHEWMDTTLSYLPGVVHDALLAQSTRPRVARFGDGVLLILRGLNTNPGAEPEDMVSLRMWVEPSRIVTLSLRELATIRDLAAAIQSGEGPADAGTLLAFVADLLTFRLTDYVDAIDVEGDALEKAILENPTPDLRPRVNDLRGEVVDLRQFLMPQRDTLSRLATMDLPFLTDETRRRLSEAQEAAQRALDVSESLRERLIVLRDELTDTLNERLNNSLYRLSVISMVFLPLGVLTGLMGINLAGMPGADWTPAFWVFTACLLGITAVLLIILRVSRWL